MMKYSIVTYQTWILNQINMSKIIERMEEGFVYVSDKDVNDHQKNVLLFVLWREQPLVTTYGRQNALPYSTTRDLIMGNLWKESNTKRTGL